MSTIKYKCDTCKREIETIERLKGLTTFNKCIITKGCRGRLYKIGRNPYNVREFHPEPENVGLSNFFPRRAFFEYRQELPSDTWKITHNMGVYPAVTVYSTSDESPTPLGRDDYEVLLIDSTSIELKFAQAITGVAQCVARSTKDLAPTSIPLGDDLFQVSNNNVLTFAVLGKITREITGNNPLYTCDPDNPLQIEINISIKEPEREEIFCTENITTHVEAASPWIDWDALISRQRRNYCIKSVNLKDFVSIQEFYDDISDMPDGTKLKIISIDYGTGFKNQSIRSRNLFSLLADAPFNHIDKRTDILIDVGEVSASRLNDSFTFIGGELFLPVRQVEKIYPPLKKSEAIFS